PLLYKENVYEKDALGSEISFDAQGNAVMKLLHKAGDPVLDSQGKQVLLYRKGDVKLKDGVPVALSQASVLRQVPILF
ncbi:hypothetical protein ACXWN7_10610, partial [Streptococcus pyogenes]